MFHRPRFHRPLSTGLFLAGGFAFISATAIGASALAETVIVGGTGKPSVTVDLSVLEELGAAPIVPRLLMPGSGPARNGLVTLRRPGTTTQRTAPVAAPTPKIVLTPPPLKKAPLVAKKAPPAPVVAMPEAPAAIKKAPLVAKKAPPLKKTPLAAKKAPLVAAPKPKIIQTPPALKKAPAAVKKAPSAMAEPGPRILLTPPPPEKAPPPPAPIVTMPDAPPPPVVLTEPKTPPPAALTEPKAPPKKSTASATPAKKAAFEETAKLPPASAPLEPGKPIQVVFGSESALLSDKAKAKLEKFAVHLKSNSGLRIQLLAHASGTEEAASQARRLSLSRALVVRSFLIEQGLPSIRIDVRALGNKGSGKPADRVDLVFTDG
ncbi:OmpA family protein [Rhodospirillaceae bacterium AH-315-P19]|nr:OmpA family protein [Rhodospirillaceae bacterium AH-315-P19]